MKTIYLKTWPVFYQMMLDGTKTFDLRKDDRDFQAGDLVVQQEYEPETKTYTGREMTVGAGRVFRNMSVPGLEDGYCIIQCVILDHDHDLEDLIEQIEILAERAQRIKGRASA